MARNIPYQHGNAQEVPLSEFSPDTDLTSNGILLDMVGAMPTVKGFAAQASAVQFAGGLPANVQGGALAYYTTTDSTLFAGTATTLYSYTSPGALGPFQKTTGFTLQRADRWRFFQFGDDVIACAPNTAPQVASGPNPLTFAPLTGNAPFGAITGCTTAGTAFLFGGGTPHPDPQQWNASAPGVDNNWTPDVQTLAATGFLYDLPGPIVACAPFYRTVIVFKEQAIWVGSFVGPPFSWSFQLISDLTGTRAQEAVVVLPDCVAFLGNDDFYITTGTVPIRIPNNVKEWFFQNADPNLLDRTQAWYDVEFANVYWHFVSNNPPFVGLPDLYVVWNARSKRWGKGRRMLRTVPTPNTSITSFKPVYFDVNNVPQQLSGPPENVILTTGWMGMEGRLTQFMRWRAKYNVYPATQQLMTYSTNVLSTVPPVPALTVPALGFDDWFNLRQTNRWHQAVLSTSGPMEIMAYAYEARPAGIR